VSIDELIKAASIDEELGAVVLDREESETIIAALRAGQQMRGQFALPDESKDFPGMIAAIDFFEACKAWDKAVGEGKSE